MCFASWHGFIELYITMVTLLLTNQPQLQMAAMRLGDPGQADDSKCSFLMVFPYLVLKMTEYQTMCSIIPETNKTGRFCFLIKDEWH